MPVDKDVGNQETYSLSPSAFNSVSGNELERKAEMPKLESHEFFSFCVEKKQIHLFGEYMDSTLQ